jgi:hypothetical protein
MAINQFLGQYRICWSYPMAADPFPFFFQCGLYDIALPARVDVAHRTQHLLSLCYISKVPFLRKTFLGPDINVNW